MRAPEYIVPPTTGPHCGLADMEAILCASVERRRGHNLRASRPERAARSRRVQARAEPAAEGDGWGPDPRALVGQDAVRLRGVVMGAVVGPWSAGKVPQRWKLMLSDQEAPSSPGRSKRPSRRKPSPHPCIVSVHLLAVPGLAQ